MLRAQIAACALLLLACRAKQAPSDAAPRPPPGAPRGTFAMTYYWIAAQPAGERAVATLYTRDCKAVAKVSDAFADDLALNGTGRLADNRVLGVVSDCDCAHSPCVRVLPRELPWGVGRDNRPLVPFVSIAVDPDVVPIGTHLYIQELDGVRLLSYFPAYHDGCVVADDTGQRIKGQHLDWYVGRRHHYVEIDAALHFERVTVRDGGERCR